MDNESADLPFWELMKAFYSILLSMMCLRNDLHNPLLHSPPLVYIELVLDKILLIS